MNIHELQVIQGLLKYLNENFTTDSASDLRPDIQLIDSNGETAGCIEYDGLDHIYLLVKVT